MPIVLEVQGQPVPQPRARIAVRNGFGQAYYESNHPIHAYRMAIQLAAAGRRVSGPVCATIDAVFARPKSHWRKHDLNPKAPPWPRADADNIQKGVYDALTKAGFWGDDGCVVRWGGSKRWAARNEQAKTTITIEKVAI